MNIIEPFAKPALSGLTAGLLTRYVTYGKNGLNNNYQLTIDSAVPIISKFNGKQVNLALITGVALVASSYLADVVSDHMFQFLSKDQILENKASGIFQLAVTGATAVGVHGILSPGSIRDRGVINILALSVGTELIAGLAYNRFVRPFFHEAEEEMIPDYGN